VTVYAGQPLLAADVQAERDRERFIQKTGAQDHISNTTFTNDTELTCSMEANSRYEVRIHAGAGGTDGDLKTRWQVPTGATGYKMVFGPTEASTDREDTNMRAATHGHGTTATYGVNHATNFVNIQEIGLVITTTAGTFVWQHAQNASTANPSSITENSYMVVTKRM
jgi:hypothetical protein